jgi:hypothetical protein
MEIIWQSELLSQVIEQAKSWCRQRVEGGILLRIMAGECIRHDVHCARLVVDREVKAEKFASPLTLWHCGQLLVYKKFKLKWSV